MFLCYGGLGKEHMDDFRKNPGGFPPFYPKTGAEGRRNQAGMGGRALPFYMTYPLPMFWEEEDAASRDLDYLIQLYPEKAKKYRERISRILDSMDYRGSMIYDEYPDRLALFRLAENIQSQIQEEEEKEAASGNGNAGERTAAGTPGQMADRKDRKTLIQILLYYEIFRRRRGRGKSWRGWSPGGENGSF